MDRVHAKSSQDPHSTIRRKDDLSRYLRQAAKEEIVITRHGKAAGVLIGFASEDDWFDYRLRMIYASWIASPRPVPASVPDAASCWRTWRKDRSSKTSRIAARNG